MGINEGEIICFILYIKNNIKLMRLENKTSKSFLNFFFVSIKDYK